MLTPQTAGHKCCKKIASLTQDIRVVGYITIELMQKYPNSSGSIGLEDFDHWPSDGNTIGFLMMTMLATSVDQLLLVSRSYLLISTLC